MADNLTTQSTSPATVPSSTQIATDDVAGVHFQRVKLVDGTADSSAGIPGDATNGLDVDVTRVQGVVHVDDNGSTLSVDDGGGSLTVDGTVGVSGSVAVTGPLTDTQLRASSVPVSGPLTDTQLRAAAVPVSGTVTITDGSGPVTVDGSVSVSNFPATQPVSGTVTVQDGGGSITVDGTVGVSGTVTVDGSAVTQPVSAVALPLPTGAATSANQSSANTSLSSIDGKLPSLTNTGTTMPVDIKNTSVVVDTELPAATALADGVSNPTVPTVGAALIGFNGTTWDRVRLTAADAVTVTQVPSTSGGLTGQSWLTTASTNGTVVKASAGQLFGWVFTNTSGQQRYVKIYDSATVTAGSGTPKLRIMVPGNTTGAGIVAAEFTNGIAFSTGICFTVTGGVGDSDITTVSANETIINLFYK